MLYNKVYRCGCVAWSMTNPGALFLCIALITFLTAIMAETPAAEYNFANCDLATKMYNVLKNEEGNVFFSPYSIQVALSMAYAGTGGNTAKEFQKVMGFPEDKAHFGSMVKKALDDLTRSKDVTFNNANAMFLQDDYVVKEAFYKSIVDYFMSDVKRLKFADNVKATQEINSYVEKHTNGKIKDLFTSDSFNEMTKMVLVNAVYFKGTWLHQFDAEGTVKGDFHLNANSTVQVDFMNLKKRFNFHRNDELKAAVLEMKYQGDMSMVVVVPNEVEGLKDVEAKLVNMDLKKLTESGHSQEVELKFPKFKLEQSHNLKSILKKIGINEMFEAGKADFSEVTDGKELYVSDAVHKAFIEVNEEGSEAAAATACKVRQKRSAILSEPENLTVDHPFLFFIEGQGLIYFFGCLLSPADGRVGKKPKVEETAGAKRSSKWKFFKSETQTCNSF